MRVAFFLDNRGIAGRGRLPDPLLGNPAIGGTEYAFLAVTALLQGTELEPLLLLTAPQLVDGLETGNVSLASDLADALRQAECAGATAFVFRPGVLAEHDWPALETSQLPLVAWFHNLGCAQQARTEALSSLAAWVLVSGAQLDHFRHSRLARKAVVIPNPVAVPPEAGRSRSLAEARSAHDLAFVGAITPFKGFDRLAGQWGAIAAVCPQARLRVFGGADLYGPRATQGELTPFERHCRGLLEASGYQDRVIFAGTCGMERYTAFHEVAVGVVNPSGRDETFCLSAAEFGACGIPVVTARRHALIQTVRHGVTGLLARTDQELASNCIRLLQNPSWAWNLGQQARHYVGDVFGLENVRAGWIILLQQIELGSLPTRLPPSTPWYHEQRWLRQLWGMLLMLPRFPSWPVMKARVKQLFQGGEHAIQPRGVAAMAGVFALLLWGGLVFGKFGGNPSGLARIGDELPRSPRLQGEELVVLAGKRGNDGQQFLALALDPLQLDLGTSAAVDNPIYRGKRLLYPLLAWMIGLGQPRLILWAMGLINVACIGGTAWLVARWAQLCQRSPLWGFGVLALPGYWITLSLNTADLVATGLMLMAAVAWQEKSRSRLLTSLALAVLARETELLAWFTSFVRVVRERLWHWCMPIVFAPLPLLIWTFLLDARFASVPDGSLARLHFVFPFSGLTEKLEALIAFPSLGVADAHLGRIEWLFDVLSFLFLLLNLVVLAFIAKSMRSGGWLRTAACFYLLAASCTSMQILNRFPDYTRVWIDLSSLSLIGLIALRSSALSAWLLSASVLSIGYFAGFLLAK